MKTLKGYLNIENIKENIVHVSFSKKEIERKESLILEDKIYEIAKKGGVDSYIETSVNERYSAITFTNKKTGEVFLKEKNKTLVETPVYKYTTGGEEPIVDRVKTVDGERNFIKNLRQEVDRTAYRGKIEFCFNDGEGIYGLGQGEDGIYNLRNHSQYLYQHNMRIPMPFFYSDNGYGILLDCACLMTWEDSEAGSYVYMDCIDQMDYYVIYGPEFEQVLDGLRFLTGKASMLPKWAFGYVQSKEQYYTAKELVDIVAEYRRRNVPLDVVVQDWNTWEPGNWGEKILDKERYADMPECAEKIHEMGAHTMVSVWPNSNFGGKNHTEFFENGLMLGDLATYDAFSEEGRNMYWRQAKEGLFDMGFDSWWCDSTEPFSGPDWGGEERREPWERYNLVGTEHKKYLDAARANAYALMHAKGMYEGQKKDYPDLRMLNLTRSGYAGGQKYGAVLWSGDIAARWDVMKKQVVEALNMSMSGYPYWTLDIGGFFTVREDWQSRGCSCNTDSTPKWFWQGEYERGVEDPAYRELYTRWIQMGTFLPMFRSHGTDTPREIWNFGDEGDMFYDTIKKYIELRYEFMPTVYSMAGHVRINNKNMLRSLICDFRSDEIARKTKDQFMFGDNLLICPVLEPMYYTNEYEYPMAERKERVCYLPKGCDWIDYFSGEEFTGGQYITRETPIDIMPIFVKKGAILFKKQGMQHTFDKENDPVIIEIWNGASTECVSENVLYEDEGEGYGFEKGEYSLIKFSCDGKILTIGKREGKYNGMQNKRIFTVRNGKDTVDVAYDGSEVIVELQ